MSTQINGLPGKVTVKILSTGSLALTKPRMVVAHLWFQPREVKQFATILPVFLGPNRSLLSNTMYNIKPRCHQWCTQEFFFGGGGSTNSVEDRENGDLGAVAPQSGVLEAAVIWYKKFNFI
jgi:hypothetical protein